MKDLEEGKEKLNTEPKKNNIKSESKANLDILDVGGLFSYIRHPTRMFFLNLLASMARGLGFAIGMTILAALLIFLLRRVVDVPYIGKFIARILEVVETQRSIYR